MTIINIDSIKANGKSSLNMNVAVENLLDIRVSAGAFKLNEVDYSLDSDTVETIDVDPTYDTIVKEK